MKNRLNYKARKNLIATVIVIILLILTFISTYAFVKARIESQAATEERGMTEDRAENITRGEQEERTENNIAVEQGSSVENNTQNNEQATTQNTNNNNNTTNTTVQTANTNVPTQPNVVTRTETQTVENEVVLVGFSQSDINIDANILSGMEINLPKITRNIAANTQSNTNVVLNGDQITYTITIENESEEELNQINVSALIPEGTELVENSISDNGIAQNGTISWKVDIATEKTVSYTVKVTKEAGIVEAKAVVEGIETGSIQTPIVKAELVSDNDQVNTNDTITYTIKIQNTAEIPANINVEAIIPEKTELETEGLEVTERTIIWNKQLETSESVEYSYTVKVTEYEKDYTIENTVKVNGSNSNTVSSAIVDETIPTLNFNNGAIVKEYTVEASDENYAYMTVTNMKTGKTERIEETTFTLPTEEADNVRYDIIAYDKAGNASKKQNIYHDNVLPVITGTGKKDKKSELANNEIYKEVTLKVTDGSLKKVFNGEELLAELEDNYKPGEVMSYENTFTAEGTYTIKAIDRLGNESTITFTIDTTKPEISGVEDQKYYNTDVTPVVTDKNLKNVTVKLNGTNIKNEYKLGDTLTKEGTYTLVATDKAMNKTKEITFVIDKTAPTFDNLTSGTHFENEIPVKVNETNFAYVEVYNQDAGKTEQIKEKEFKLSDEATYKIIAVDLAGNKSNAVWVAIDNTSPVIEGLEEGKEFYNSDITLTISDKFLTKVTVNEEEITGIEKDSKNENGKLVKTFKQEGTYTVVATDKFGHKTTKTFTVDKTPAKRLSSDFYANGVQNSYPNEQGQWIYVNTGKTIVANAKFDEELMQNPIIVLKDAKNKEYKLEVTYRGTDENGKHLYQATYTIEETMAEGEITYTISEIYDKAGNKTEDITKATNSRRIVFDKTPAKRLSSDFYANGVQNSYPNKEGQWIYVNTGKTIVANAKFDEELMQNPIIVLKDAKNKEYKLEVTYRGTDENGKHLYQATYTIEETMAEGEITYTISEIYDKAGNKTEDITKATNSRRIVFDKTAPKIEYSTIREKGGMTKVEKDGITYFYVKNGNNFEFAISFNEELKANPTAVIGNKEIELKINEKVKNEESKYLYEGTLEIPENETELPEGTLEITVKNIIDLAGNEANEINQKETTNHRSVIYDRTAPTLNFGNGDIVKEKTVEVTDTNFDYMTVENMKTEEIQKIEDKTFTLPTEEADNVRYKIIAYDKAGNSSSDNMSIYHDNVKPVITATAIRKAEEVEFGNNGAYQKITLNISDGSLKKIVKITDGNEEILEEKENNYTNNKVTSEITFEEDGTYTIKAIDRAGNESEELTFTIDTKLNNPSCVEILSLNAFEGNTEYTKNGKAVRIYLTFDEELASERNSKFGTHYGIFTINGQQTALTRNPSDDKDGKLSYIATYTIPENANIEDGELKFEVTVFGDKVGNTIAPITETINARAGRTKVIYDNTAPTFNVEDGLLTNQKVLIKIEDENYEYANISNVTSTKQKNKEFTLEREGNSTITAYDKAGNKNEITITIDKKAPERNELRIVGGIHDENKIQHIKENGIVNVYVGFDEELGINPKLKINDGEEIEFSNTGKGFYGAQYKINSETAEGEIQVKVYGYKDIAGNEGKILTNADMTIVPAQSKVIVDKTSPEISIDKNVEIQEKLEKLSDFEDDIREKISDNITSVENLKVQATLVTKEDGTQVINYKVIDQAGNFTEETRNLILVKKSTKVKDFIELKNAIEEGYKEIIVTGKIIIDSDYTISNEVTIKRDKEYRNNPTTKNNHLFLVKANHTLTLGEKVTIDEDNVEGNAGIFVSGKLIINGARITNHNGVDVSYSAIYINTNGTVEMIDGTIDNNKMKNGGGAAVYISGTFNMYGGTIKNNTTISDGAAVYMNTGTFNMNGGTISNNTTESSGAGVYARGIFNINDGIIENNTAKSYAGGVYVASTFNMNGGIIRNNTAEFAGGVALGYTSSVLNQKEGALIYNNKAKQNSCGHDIFSNGKLTIAENELCTWYKADETKFTQFNEEISGEFALRAEYNNTDTNIATYGIASNARRYVNNDLSRLNKLQENLAAVTTPATNAPESTPTVDAPATSTPESAPVVDTPATSTPESTPTVDAPATSTPESTPVVDATATGTPESTPVVDAPVTSTPESTPVVDATATNTPESTPATNAEETDVEQ